jgi:hypothetical protein
MSYRSDNLFWNRCTVPEIKSSLKIQLKKVYPIQGLKYLTDNGLTGMAG